MNKEMSVKVKNVPAIVRNFVIAKLSDGELWYWGSWNNEEIATQVAKEIGGLIVNNDK